MGNYTTIIGNQASAPKKENNRKIRIFFFVHGNVNNEARKLQVNTRTPLLDPCIALNEKGSKNRTKRQVRVERYHRKGRFLSNTKNEYLHMNTTKHIKYEKKRR